MTDNNIIFTQYEIGKQDGKHAASRLWESPSNRERTIYLHQYDNNRRIALQAVNNTYERGFVEGFLQEVTRRGDAL